MTDVVVKAAPTDRACVIVTVQVGAYPLQSPLQPANIEPIPGVARSVTAVAGVYLAELQRLNDSSAAWRSTWATTKAIGVGMLVELAAGVLAVLVWGLGALALA